MDFTYNIFDNMECPVLVRDKNDKILYANKCFYTELNLPLNLDVCDTQKYIDSNQAIKKLLQNTHKLKSGDTLKYNDKIYKYIVVNNNQKLGHITYIYVNVTDIERKTPSNQDKNILKIVIDNIPELIFYKDKDLRYVRINKQCEKFYNDRGVYDIVGKTDLELPLDKCFLEECTRNDLDVLKSKQVMYIEEEVPLPGTSERGVMQTIKTPIINEDGSVDGLVGIVIDITKQKNIENRLRYLSYTDRLTELYNRTFFEEKIKELKDSNQYPIGIITGDVNGLKDVNDYLGHNEGDNLIKQVSSILKEVCDNYGYVIRWGGDEFITILPNATDEKCISFINKVDELCSLVRKNPYKISISQGYYLMTEKISIDEALRMSDKNMYIAKKKNQIKKDKT